MNAIWKHDVVGLHSQTMPVYSVKGASIKDAKDARGGVTSGGATPGHDRAFALACIKIY